MKLKPRFHKAFTGSVEWCHLTKFKSTAIRRVNMNIFVMAATFSESSDISDLVLNNKEASANQENRDAPSRPTFQFWWICVILLVQILFNPHSTNSVIMQPSSAVMLHESLQVVNKNLSLLYHPSHIA